MIHLFVAAGTAAKILLFPKVWHCVAQPSPPSAQPAPAVAVVPPSSAQPAPPAGAVVAAGPAAAAVAPPPLVNAISLDANVVFNMVRDSGRNVSRIKDFLKGKLMVMSPRVKAEVKDRSSKQWMQDKAVVEIDRSTVATAVAQAMEDAMIRRKTGAQFVGNERIDLEGKLYTSSSSHSLVLIAAYLDACAAGVDHITFDVNFVSKLVFSHGMFQYLTGVIRNGGLSPKTLYVAVPRGLRGRVFPTAENDQVTRIFPWVELLRG